MFTPEPSIAAAGVGPQRPHAVVIGAGFGGLAAAIRLSARGYRVTVLERLEQAGGRAAVFRQDGFVFDAGPTIVTAPFLFEELWKLCGRRLEDDVTLVPLDPCYTVRFHDGTEFRCHVDDAAMMDEIARFNPHDVDGYKAYLEESRRCFETGFEGMVDRPFLGIGAMVRALPDLVRRRAYRSVYAQVSRFVSDEKLRTALSFHPLFIGGNPMRVTALMSLIAHLERKWGVHYVMGGTGALVAAMVGLLEARGVEIRLNCEVEEIMVRQGRAVGVRLADETIVDAALVVSNADAATTYRRLLKSVRRRRWTDRRLERSAYSMSLFVWYFGTRGRYDDVAHHTVMMGPRYGELLADIFDRKILADDFSLYLHRPTASDPAMAPAGCDAFYVLAPVPNLDGATDWRVAGEPYRRKIAAHLEATIMPGLSARLVTSRTLTPLDFRDRLQSHKGAAFAMEPLLTQSAWFRPHNKSEEIEDLYFVGAGTHPGAGLPGVVASARILDKVVPHGAYHG